MKKSRLFTAGVLALTLALGLVLAGGGCSTDDDGGGSNMGGNTGGNNNPGGYTGGNTAVTFSSVTANGSSTQTTTQLTLTFSQAITGLSAEDITLSGVSGVSKGTLSGSGPTYTLGISGITSGGTLSVAVAKSGYDISGSPKSTTIYYSSGGGGEENVVIILGSNPPYGWQKTYEPASLLNGAKIEQGDKYTFTYSFTSDVAIDQLQVLLVDNCEAEGWAWKVISGTTVIKQNIAANTVVSGSVTLTATGTATNATPEANRLAFQAGTGTASQPTLTFTTLRLEKGTGTGGGTPDGSSQENAIPLTENIWTDSELVNSRTDVQWFKFTATAARQYIHVNFGTLNSFWGIEVQMYDSSGNGLGSNVNLGSTKQYNVWDVSPGNDYFVKVYDGQTGDYQIGFTKSTLRPGIRTTLVINEWSDGNIATSNGEQWFKFTATASTHYIHLSPGTLTYVGVQLYDSNGNLVGGSASMQSGIISRTTVVGQEYHIWVWPEGNYSGSYRIGVNTSSTAPGISWTPVAVSFSPNAIAYGNGRFVAVSNASQSAYSTDGGSWTTVNISSTITTTFLNIAYGSIRFLAVSSSGFTAESSNGTSWSFIPNSTFGSTRINSTVYGDGYFVTVGDSGKAARMFNSPAPGEWTAIGDMKFGTSNIYDITYGNGKFVAVGQGGKAAYSSDGIIWTAVTDSGFGNSDIYTITYGDGKFVAAGYSGRTAYSSDGITWTSVDNTTFGSSSINDIAFGGGLFVAVGQNGKAAYSSDSITWKAVDTTTFNNRDINTIAFGNGRFVAGGESAIAYWTLP